VARVGVVDAVAADPAEIERLVAERLAPQRAALQREQAGLAASSRAMAKAAAELAELYEQAQARLEQQVMELAIDVARTVLMQEVQAGRYEIEAIVREALAQVPARQEVVVHLSPADLERCSLAESPAPGVRFVADANLAAASCLVETREGVVESSVEASLDAVENAMRQSEPDA
jgi:flagellar assembly protein FliH